MAGLLDGYVGDDTVKDEYGMTQADRREPIWSGLIKAGLLAVAGGGNLMPEQRAQYLAQAGGALGDIPGQMVANTSARAQQQLRGQQITEGKRKIIDRDKVRALMQDPEIQKTMQGAQGADRIAIQAAIETGDIGALNAAIGNLDKSGINAQKLDLARQHLELAREKNKPKVDAGGNVTLPNGDVYNQLYGWIVKDGKVVDQAAAAAAAAAAAGGGGGGGGGAAPKDIDAEIATWSQYNDPHVRNNQPLPKTTAGYQPTISPFENRDYSVLNNLPPVLASQVQRIGDYDETVASNSRQAKDPRLLKLVSDYTKGDWNQGEYAFRNQQRKEYSMAGATGKGMNAMDTSYAHLGTLYEAAQAMQQALNTGNSALANEIKLKIAKQFGQPEGVAFETVAAAVSNEVAKAFRGAGTLNQSEQEHMQKLFSAASGPKQIQAAIEYSLELLEGKEKAIKNAWSKDMRTPMRDFLSAGSREKAEFIRKNPLGGAPAAAQKPGQVPTVTTKEEYDALTPGASFTGSDGKTYTKPK